VLAEILSEDLMGTDKMEDVGVVILEWIFGKLDGTMWIACICLRKGALVNMEMNLWVP
jgi:hypothetical protein